MASTDLAIGIIILSQTGIGLLGNSAFLCHYILSDITGSRMRPIDPILQNLTLANSMVLLLRGVTHTVKTFRLPFFFHDVICKLLFYLHRVGRGVSLGSTCLLSIFQAIIISPGNSRWLELKSRAPKFIGPCICLCWVLHMLGNAPIPMHMTAKYGRENLTGVQIFPHCTGIYLERLILTLQAVLFTSIDVICLGPMIGASGSMVLILFRHKQRVQHIHSPLSSRSSPETRAIHSVLTLVSIFVFFYAISAYLTIYVNVLDRNDALLAHAIAGMDACFPTLCPFVLISHYTTFSRLCPVC